MSTYKKALLLVCLFSLIVNLLLGLVPISLARRPQALAHGACYVLVDGVAALVLLWLLRKDTGVVSSTLGALGTAVLAFLLVTASDFIFPH